MYYNFKEILENNEELTYCELGDNFSAEVTPEVLGFSYFNPNPRGSVTGDCVKRAIVVATGMDYRELELFMNRNKVHKDRPYNDGDNFKHCIELLGGVKINMAVPKGTNRWHVKTINKVMHNYPHISYCISVSKHLIGVRDQIIFDLYDDRIRDKGIYNLFLFGASKEEVQEIQAMCSRGN